MKKFLCVLICSAIILGCLTVGTFAADLKRDDSYSVGDVDFDKSVNGKDSNLLNFCGIFFYNFFQALSNCIFITIIDEYVSTHMQYHRH